MIQEPIFPDYDKQIKFLTKYPNQIAVHWTNYIGLFNKVGTDITRCGCLTQIKDTHNFLNKVIFEGKREFELESTIMEDERIPKSFLDITPENLQAFKEYQEFADMLDPFRWINATHGYGLSRFIDVTYKEL